MTDTNSSTSFFNTQPIRNEDIAADKEKLIQKYPHLLIVNKEKEHISSLATAAKNIRTELKKAFPTIKFSVRTERFAGGDSIDVSWTDGATYRKIKDIIGKYQYGEFNGIEGIYEHNNNLFNDIFGAVTYVFANRDITPLLYSKAAQLLGWTITGIFHSSSCYLDGLDYLQTEAVRIKASEIDFLNTNQKMGSI